MTSVGWHMIHFRFNITCLQQPHNKKINLITYLISTWCSLEVKISQPFTYFCDTKSIIFSLPYLYYISSVTVCLSSSGIHLIGQPANQLLMRHNLLLCRTFTLLCFLLKVLWGVWKWHQMCVKVMSEVMSGVWKWYQVCESDVGQVCAFVKVMSNVWKWCQVMESDVRCAKVMSDWRARERERERAV